MSDYLGVTHPGLMEKQAREPDIVERLEMELRDLTRRKKEVEAALDALAKNPEIKEILKLVSRINYSELR